MKAHHHSEDLCYSQEWKNVVLILLVLRLDTGHPSKGPRGLKGRKGQRTVDALESLKAPCPLSPFDPFIR